MRDAVWEGFDLSGEAERIRILDDQIRLDANVHGTAQSIEAREHFERGRRVLL